MEDEQKPVEEVVEEKPVEEKVEDRPEVNYKAELERKNRELEVLRSQMTQREAQPAKRDPNDMTTWADHELKAVLSTPNPEYAQAREQARDIMDDRRIDAKLNRRMETEKRVSADLELKAAFPEALNPSSELAIRMDELTAKYDLSKSPAGRLVAAKLAKAELNKGNSATDAKARKSESDRVARVKSQLVDGDRAKPTNNEGKNLEKTREELKDQLLDSKHEGKQVDAISRIMHDRGMSQKEFFGNR